MERHRRLIKAALAEAARSNLTGFSMGQLRTANNRRNRAIRQTVAHARAAAGTPVEVAVAAKTGKRPAKVVS